MIDSSILAATRAAVERLALPGSEQTERLSRQRMQPDELARVSASTLRQGLDRLGSEFSPVLRLRLEALVEHLALLSGTQGAPEASRHETLWHSQLPPARYLAEAALREPWPAS